MNKYITENTEHGPVTYDVFSLLSEKRNLFLYDFIDDKVATDTVAAMMDLNLESEKDEIVLYINSEQGDIRSVFMIYDVMNIIKAPIKTVCLGSAMGELLILLAGGTKGMRFATKSSSICLNQLNFPGSVYSSLVDISVYKKQHEINNKNFLKVISKKTGQPLKKVTNDAVRNNFMTAEQAKNYGLIDYVIEANGNKSKSNTKNKPVSKSKSKEKSRSKEKNKVK